MDVLVVGAGLSGLTAASELSAAGRSVVVADARTRVGGRIMTIEGEDGGLVDLGATWHWADQPAIQSLAVELGVTAFPQPAAGVALHETHGAPLQEVETAAGPEVRRFAGGTQQLCDRLAARLPSGALRLGERVTALAAGATGVQVSLIGADGQTSSMEAGAVVVAAPPRLVLQDISFTPGLPADVRAAMEATPTWMGEALKCVAVYETPFWREAGRSGTALSDVGPLSEVHDASEPGGPPALWGFVALDADWRDMGPQERVPAALDQLARLFGPEAADPVQYVERDWWADPNTCENEHRHGAVVEYGHPALAGPLWDGRLVWAGTETAAQGGGHMEGAVVAGRRASRLLLGG